MAFIFARVELRDAADGAYEDLHSYMRTAKCHRRVKDGGKLCDLSWTYYASDGYESSGTALKLSLFWPRSCPDHAR
jgi:hypothetical protein